MNYEYKDLIEILEKHNSEWEEYINKIKAFFYDLKKNLIINLKTTKENIVNFVDKNFDKSDLLKFNIINDIKNSTSIEYSEDGWSITKLLFIIETNNQVTDKNVTYSSPKYILHTIFTWQLKIINNDYIFKIKNHVKELKIPIKYNENDLNKLSDFIISEFYYYLKNSIKNWLNNKKKPVGFETKPFYEN